jgi:serine/threonine protein kinase
MTPEIPPAVDDRHRKLPVQRIDAACDRFEAAWREGRNPRIEDLLDAVAGPERPALLRELIGLEVELRRGRGEHPTAGEYHDRFPGQTALADAAFTETAVGPGINRPQPSRTREDTSRSLLLGLLALQNNFIDRDALLAAFNSWVADRSRSLGQILLERGALSPSRHLLLEALVAEHVKLHGDDPEQSLAALSSIGSVRDDLARVTDPDLQHSLAHVSAARQDRSGDPYRTGPGSSVGDATSAGTRFRILRPHAKGGLGEVFIALDTELNRDVALKEIQDHLADDPRYRARFEFEAEVTGGLEHPGIVPVYGLGHTADGRPFYAMRFIKGNSLKEAIRRFHQAERQPDRDPGRSTLELRELLGRFMDVCDAVAYAHSRRVLHRDLKPGNIMLGKYGETLVVDWGLAKALDQPEPESPIEHSELPLKPASGSALEPTLAGAAVGTPAYMSPEQVDGRVGELGVRSDVYCLGATLYHLLTGHAPYEAEQVGDIYQKILAGEIPRPRSLNPRVAPALEAICLKALALRAEGRYATAEALKADIERWLADEPVTAWHEPLARRAQRWARRNRTAVSGVVAALLAGLIGLAAVAVVQARANSALGAKNLQLIAANAATVRALTETQEEKQKTEAALAQSEESRQRAEVVLSFLKDDVLAATRPEGQEGGLGKDVTVRQAVDAAEPKITAAFNNQPTVEASIRDTLGETYFYLGEPALAIRQYQRALELRTAKLGPDHPDTLTSMDSLAVAYRNAGQLEEAIPLHEESLRLLKARLGPDHPHTLASRDNLALVYFDAGRTAEAFALLEANLKLYRSKLGPDHPDTLISMNNLAAAYRVAGRPAEAIPLHEEDLKLSKAKLGPDHPHTLISMGNLAAAYLAAGRTAEAIPLHEAALQLFKAKLGADHPHTLQTMNHLAAAYRDAGRPAEAIPLHEAALQLFKAKLGADHPDTLGSRDNLATAYLAAGRTTEALTLHETTLKLFEAKLGPDHPSTLESRNNLAEAYRASGRTAEAITMHEATLKLFESKLGPDHPHTLLSRNDLAGAHESLGRWSDAEALRRDALARRRKTTMPDSPLLAGDLAGLGRNLLKQSRWSEAEPVLRECLAIRAKAIPDDWPRFHAMSLLGGALLSQGQYAKAELLLLQGYEGMKAREATIPVPDKPRLLEAAERVVKLYESWGRPEQATAWKSKLGLADLPADAFAQP